MLLPRNSAARMAQATRNVAVAMIVLPDSDPTDLDNSSHDLRSSLASARVVRVPRTRLPIPAAMNTAATGPFGFSTAAPAPEASGIVFVSSMVSTSYETGAALVMKAPRAPAIPAITNAAVKNAIRALRTPWCLIRDVP